MKPFLFPSKTSGDGKYKMETLIELLVFLRARKKLFLAPIIIVMVAVGGLLILAQGSVFAPFVYTLF